MKVQQFFDRWSFWYANTPPYRPSLRRNYPERWIRIHSLPGAKRFAGTESERDELLRRHNFSSAQVLGEATEVAFVQAYGNGYRGEQESDSVEALGVVLVDDVCDSWATDTALADYLGEDVSFGLTLTTWRTGGFDELIQTVASGGAAALMFVNLDTGGIYSPYDGGADLFICDESTRSEVRKSLEPWLSERSDGF